MQIEQCRKIILLTRLRERARRRIESHSKAGNAGVAQIYARIDAWLEGQMGHVISEGRRASR
ncbi:hypothetical protein MMA231_01411 [Asticcacaulis sp. MM231]|uniref:hypothetical protein n=1 Tax=Asticcacaulis sp. MM231 TaxID=3157666 RepID=UPI0032D58DFB